MQLPDNCMTMYLELLTDMPLEEVEAHDVAADLLTLNEAGAKALGLAAADTLRLTIDGEIHALPVTIDPSLPDKTIGVPVGAHGLMGVRLPAAVSP